MIKSVRLRYIQIVDFRKSEATNFAEFVKDNLDLAQTLRGDDAVLFVSGQWTQLCFVYGFEMIKDVTHQDAERQVLASSRLRLMQGGWSPGLLADYARKVGLTLVGIRSFQQLAEDRRKQQP